ncbi:hypothetical protein [Acinetobacter gerneri]|jgi:uncharacterized membrane protein YhhN|uniref:hypothetical protein n=1 Tax=Acinetobacter gerneri TaxID=202952 RepID=UPI0023F375C7|nr:hypothetical protein [Acinetobacter gerneri]MCH4246010.1 hypothetical protein [Acinetobacter gerneri]
MLTFWYSEHCTRQIKLLLCLITCAVIYISSLTAKLEPVFVVISLAIGFITHLIYIYQDKLSTDNPYKQGIKILNYVFPIFALISLFSIWNNENKVYWAIQAFGFMLLGLFIVSIYQNRAKRFQ